MADRIGSLSGVAIYPEATYGSDAGIAAGFFANLVGPESVGISRPLKDSPVYKAKRNVVGALRGLVNAGGSFPNGMDPYFVEVARIMKLVASDYSRRGALHRGMLSVEPISFQYEKWWNDATPTYDRYRGMRVNKADFQFGTDGAAQMKLDILGNGSTPAPAAASHDSPLLATPTDDPFVNGVSYFNALLTIGGTVQQEVSAFTMTIDNMLRQKAVVGPTASAGVPRGGMPKVSGSFGINFNDFALYDAALNGDMQGLECLWAESDPTVAPLYYLRCRMPGAILSPKPIPVGGDEVLVLDLDYQSTVDPTQGQLPAEIIFPTVGPYNVPAAKQLHFKDDGGADIDVPITTGSARTATQVVADLAAVAGLTAVFDVDLYLGRPRLTHKLTGSTHSIAVDTVPADSIHALFGLDNTVVTGLDDVGFIWEALTNLSSDV